MSKAENGRSKYLNEGEQLFDFVIVMSHILPYLLSSFILESLLSKIYVGKCNVTQYEQLAMRDEFKNMFALSVYCILTITVDYYYRITLSIIYD
jgi:hypothetical protein